MNRRSIINWPTSTVRAAIVPEGDVGPWEVRVTDSRGMVEGSRGYSRGPAVRLLKLTRKLNPHARRIELVHVDR